MIPLQWDGWAREGAVHNVMNVWHSATPEQMAEGRSWYRVAHQMAAMMMDGDVRTGAGVIAALSPQTPWWMNVELASDACESGRPSRHVGDALSKATRILAGEDPAHVLPMHRKTGQFYLCMLDPSDSRAVCIDRHAHDIAVGVRFGSERRGLDARSRYDMIAGVYRDAASRLGELPMTVQAVTWTVWRERETR